MPFQHRCPQCRSEDVQRIHRRGALKRVVLGLLGWRAYRCLQCGVQFYDRPSRPESSAA